MPASPTTWQHEIYEKQNITVKKLICTIMNLKNITLRFIATVFLLVECVLTLNATQEWTYGKHTSRFLREKARRLVVMRR